MRLAVIGRTGQLARALHRLAPDAQYYGRDALDLSASADRITEFIKALDVDAVIIAAAYTAVDNAEDDAETAQAVNAYAPKVVAEACARRGIALIHVSTDYVFQGDATTPYSVHAPTDPLGVYGRTKCDGEQGVLSAGGRTAVVRTSWVFDGTGKNFFTTMTRLAETHGTLRVVHDQKGRPSYAGHLAQALLDMLPAVMAGEASGLYHVSGTGAVISWADFARAIMDITQPHFDRAVAVTNIASSEYPTRAKRPHYSALDTQRFEGQFGALPDWQSGLRQAYKDWVKANA